MTMAGRDGQWKHVCRVYGMVGDPGHGSVVAAVAAAAILAVVAAAAEGGAAAILAHRATTRLPRRTDVRQRRCTAGQACQRGRARRARPPGAACGHGGVGCVGIRTDGGRQRQRRRWLQYASGGGGGERTLRQVEMRAGPAPRSGGETVASRRDPEERRRRGREIGGSSWDGEAGWKTADERRGEGGSLLGWA